MIIDPELLQALEIFKHFFDLIHQPMAIIDKEGKYIYYNQESAELDGYSIEQAIGKPMLKVYPNLKKEDSTMLQALHGKEYQDTYQTYYNHVGKLVDYQHTTVPLYNHEKAIIGAVEIGRNLSNVRQLQDQVFRLNRKLYQNKEQPLPEIVFASNKMQEVIDQTNILGSNDVPVLIVGETGTGKELFARLIHQTSHRRDKAFISLNCSALPTTLIESTLFGTVKGAFTGAENRQGYLELANGGTLFLDELNAMPLEMQSKLLRFLQEKTYWSLGGNKEKYADVRIVAAMNESPAELLKSGKMRSDLFYRLNVGLIKLPALRERQEDIPVLARYFIDKHKTDVNMVISGISEHALQQLMSAPWPGNVRMLENAIVRSMVLQNEPGELQQIVLDDELFDLPSPSSQEEAKLEKPNIKEITGNLTEQVENYEKQLIIDALNQANGKIITAAKLLNISRTTLQYKVKKYHIQMGVIDS
ncbi:sigma-54 interaction domain-containing protein [Gilliamella apis]|uniref:sigma-54 interaction domain-containing protein n=1 Tax=Gilliamella apis TaxID=1970738 RepID=UPI000B751A11|nr:sigma 54-interacting transcriptional regulator [Gilliamella apis]OTQ34882.1 sigma-54-dependent Fis family transcriptional regulator [Gilliamella apis]OTQ37860.1 sigma-54-dependent Fis family transcriptional regulator [Gilliamella apis]OTQ39894.1 sigma-54-dependent Fis family transcriptional regulator [Gilliamella apis]OTQ40899.1 sigma-54-dependent Fis family transcriptional regulator [Gilliamella apis]OTQ47287.1 sigma-54-dependent Fis family transcriptional regulator [Gilliamella apis]